MNCDELRPLLGPYSDGELDLVQVLAIEAHLATCPACGERLAGITSVRQAATLPGLYYSAPPALAERLHAALQHSATPARSISPWRRLAIAAVVVMAVGIAASLAWRWQPAGSADRQLAADLTSAHVRSVMSDKLHLLDIVSTDQHTVKPWFTGKINFAPDVPRLDEQGFPLLGGRLDYVGGHSAAVLVYGARQHVINLFLWPTNASPPARAQEFSVQGYHLRRWSYEGLDCWAITDANPQTLEQFERAYVNR
jgi:anti-sigma factor RsiW